MITRRAGRGGRPGVAAATAGHVPVGRSLIIGHRGASGRLPENTLAAFRGAIDDGADGIELDVRLSRDGVPVVIHDATLRRTTGSAARVSDLTAVELSKLTAVPPRRPFSTDAAAPRPSPEDLGVPTLERVLTLPETAGSILYVELKGRRSSDMELEEAVVDVIRRTGATDRVVVLSFNHASLRRVRRLDGLLRTAATVAPELRLPRPSPARLADIVERAEAGEAALHVSLATRRRFEALRDRGFRVSVWTVNSPLVGTYLDRVGVHALMTDHPARLVTARGGRR